MRKFFYLTSVVFLMCPGLAQAMYYVPSVSLTIVEYTSGEDDTFDFNILDKNNNPWPQVELVTASSTASKTISIGLLGGTTFSLTQTVPAGWVLDSANCTGDSPEYAFSSIPNGVQMDFVIGKVTCIFRNTKDSGKHPLLIVPGIMGTEMQKNNKLLWADVVRMINPLHSDSFMDPLSFNTDGEPSDRDVSLGQVIDKKPKFNYTADLVSDLTSQGYIKDHDLFTFPYDWRNDLSYTATQDDPTNPDVSLKKEIDTITQNGGKVDIIAHSQGGLVVKRLLYEKPDYADKINKIIFVGVPNLGAPKAAKALLYGDDMDVAFLGMGLDPAEVQKIGQNMPAIYELLPGSQYFSKHGQYLSQQVETISDPSKPITELYNSYDFTQTKKALKDKGLNADLIAKADTFHSADFDNLDFSASQIKTFNIVGCQTGTPDKIFFPLNRDPFVETAAGDGTVPVDSGKNILGATTYYALNSSHGTMLTQDGIRQEIEFLLTDSGSTPSNITQTASNCHYNSTIVSVHSPVDLNVYDENGNHLGPSSDGSFDIGILDAQYDIVGHEKYAILPEGHSYTVNLNATGSGSFDFYATQIVDGQTTNTAYYGNVAVATSSTATVKLNADNNQVINFTSEERVVSPSSILNADESQDITPPQTVAQVSENGDISFTATDPLVGDNTAMSSGVLNTFYNLDDKGFQTYSSSSAISATAPGEHQLTFYSVDRAGNKETAQTKNFVIAAPVAEEAPAPVIRNAGGGGGQIFYSGTSTPATTTAVQYPGEVLSESTTTPASHPNGSLILDTDGTVYLIAENVKHPFESAKRFLQMGFKFENVVPFWPGDNLLMLGMPE